MDINFFRGLSTVFVALAFIGVCWWAFSPKRKEKFKEAANLPFADEQDVAEKRTDTPLSSAKCDERDNH